jgi:hypothetical protein
VTETSRGSVLGQGQSDVSNKLSSLHENRRKRHEDLLRYKLDLLLRKARDGVNALNWGEIRFDQKRAQCLALFSEIAYYRITEEERRRVGRAKIVPCEAYQRIIAEGLRIDFDAATRGADFENVDVIQTHRFVAIVFYFNKVTVVTVRGTKFLYDWGANLNWGKSTDRYWDERERRLSFHSGFLKEAQLLAFHLRERLIDRYRRNTEETLVITGHSLGGAIAGILSGIGNRHINDFEHCYTFAGPRYADFQTLIRTGNPYNCINDFDIVPRVPPTAFGYSNSIYEFDTKGAQYTKFEDSEGSQLIHWLVTLVTCKFLRNHAIETYRRKIRGSLRSVRGGGVPASGAGNPSPRGPLLATMTKTQSH